MSEENKFTPYMREDRLPHIFCPGCGNGTIMNAFLQGMEKAEMDFLRISISFMFCIYSIKSLNDLNKFSL